jgi:hypothetical protein
MILIRDIVYFRIAAGGVGRGAVPVAGHGSSRGGADAKGYSPDP